LADYLAAVTNKFTGVFPASPGGVRLENQLLRWMSSVFGYDPNLSSGNLTSGGSIANLLAVTTAREAMDLRAADYHNAVFYFSTEAHHCIDKAIWMAGMNDAVVRKIPVDSKLKMKVNLLKEAIKEDKANGLNPFFLMGTAGTTNSGIDTV
jgi:aromatic-L-amino-acid decarboxylase